MLNCSSNFLKTLKNSIKQMFIKLEFYDSQMRYISEFTKQVTAKDIGNISVDLNRPVRRNFTFTLNNKNGEFTWGEQNLIWIDKRVKLFIGLMLQDKSVEYIPQGVFIMSEPQDTHNPQGKFTTISGQDKMFLMTDRRGIFVNETTIETGVNIGTALKIIAGKANETMFNFDPITETTPYTLTYSASDNLYKALDELALLAKGRIGYDINGFLQFKKIDMDDFDSQPITWSYKYGDSSEKFYAGNVRKMQENILANDVFVLGGSNQTSTCSYRLTVDETDPLWAGSPYSIQKIGRITYVHNNYNPDPLLTTNEECLWRSKFELRKRLGYSEKLSLNISPMFLHEESDIIEVVDDENDVNGKYLIESMSIPLNPQLMNMECRKERKVIDSWEFI